MDYWNLDPQGRIGNISLSVCGACMDGVEKEQRLSDREESQNAVGLVLCYVSEPEEEDVS